MTGPFMSSGTACRFIFQEGRQCASVNCCFGESAGMLLERPEQLLADVAACLAEGVVHPDAFAPGIDPAAPLQVGQVARHGRLRKPQHSHDVADAQLAFGLQQQDDAQTDRVGEGFQGLGEMFHDNHALFVSEESVQ